MTATASYPWTCLSLETKVAWVVLNKQNCQLSCTAGRSSSMGPNQAQICSELHNIGHAANNSQPSRHQQPTCSTCPSQHHTSFQVIVMNLSAPWLPQTILSCPRPFPSEQRSTRDTILSRTFRGRYGRQKIIKMLTTGCRICKFSTIQQKCWGCLMRRSRAAA
jgi:hypothetical protein